MCFKPGCNNPVDCSASGSDRWCEECYYPGIDGDYATYRAYREDGYSIYQSKLMVGWADPPEEENPPEGNYDE